MTSDIIDGSYEKNQEKRNKEKYGYTISVIHTQLFA